jgi:ABC-type sugar transport system ATPase subunit
MKNSQGSGEVILLMNGISKTFPGVQALKNIDFELKKGEVHALVGENGAGKTTLMNILNGMVQKDEGEILISNEEVEIRTPLDARNMGISFIHQELELILNLTVRENIFLGHELRRGLFRLIDWKATGTQTADFLKKLGIHVDPNEKVANLTIAEQQLVEIAKALHIKAKIIVMDEPTSSLTGDDVENLFRIIRDLKRHGYSIIYVSHIMEEIFEISDRITVLRGGNYVGTEVTKYATQDKIFQMIVGKEVKKRYIREKVKKGAIVLEVKGLSGDGTFQDIHFELRKGELLGIAGLMGSGRTELLETLFGARKIAQGEVFVNGKKVKIKDPESAIKCGFSYISENKRDKGLFPTLNVTKNIVVSTLDQHLGVLGINELSEKSAVLKLIQQLNIKTPSQKQIVAYLSGGNQQKVILARGIKTKPTVVMLNEPTRGIDIGAKVEIYRLLNQLKEEGLGIIMVSSELPEIMGVSDRIIVMSAGKISGFFESSSVTKQEILEAMFKYIGQRGINEDNY